MKWTPESVIDNRPEWPKEGFAFITGSIAYGAPHEGSDIDLVIRVKPETYDYLRLIADGTTFDDGEGTAYGLSLRFGQLNLICCLDDETYQEWITGTRKLIKKSRESGPVSRKKAIEALDKIRSKRNDST